AVLLLALADGLFWQQKLGISIAIFAMVFSGIIVVLRPAETSRKTWCAVMGFAALANLPVIEMAQGVSVLISGLGVISLAVWAANDRIVQLGQGVATILKLSVFGPVLLALGVQDVVKKSGPASGVRKQLMAMILPAAVGAVFIGLLAAANPFLENALETLSQIEFLSLNMFERVFFWAAVLVLVLPYLNLRPFKAVQPGSVRIKTPDGRFPSLVNTASVRNSLILFNGIFALQSGLDMLVLTGGMTLPEGMSYASYAHRGAYPLVVTALLAGAFAVGTRRLIQNNRLLRGLIFVWLAQNLFLVATAAFRLNLYIEQYALTRLRMVAFIWMLLVFIGLVLVAIQIAKHKRNDWLIKRNLLALISVIYVCGFVNFSYVIADYNITHKDAQKWFDAPYLCSLGPQALPVLLKAQKGAISPYCGRLDMPDAPQIAGWRDWGFRNWRLRRYLLVHKAKG
ncbi:MAG: DUF4173 domain-containing protein, partial [Rhodobacteraceae bacterium]|nr:DUF4173 domain-containing protein [Paracoccaceae bacterium]